jgi:hypothetical protein
VAAPISKISNDGGIERGSAPMATVMLTDAKKPKNAGNSGFLKGSLT